MRQTIHTFETSLPPAIAAGLRLFERPTTSRGKLWFDAIGSTRKQTLEVISTTTLGGIPQGALERDVSVCMLAAVCSPRGRVSPCRLTCRLHRARYGARQPQYCH